MEYLQNTTSKFGIEELDSRVEFFLFSGFLDYVSNLFHIDWSKLEELWKNCNFNIHDFFAKIHDYLSQNHSCATPLE